MGLALLQGVRVATREEVVRRLLAPAAFVGLWFWIATLQPGAFSYNGGTLLFSSAVPLAAAAVSEMFIISIGDIDVGIGYFVGLANAICAVYLVRAPLEGACLLLLMVAGYVVMGALIELRRIPSIVATLGASFIWLGLGLYVLPVPGGGVPGWLAQLYSWTPPLIPFPLLAALVLALAGSVIMGLSPLGVLLRGAGSHPDAIPRKGWSMLKIRMTAYGLAGVFGVLAGVILTAVETSGSPTASANYTLLAIAAVILGGGEFAGGFGFSVGAVAGALALSLATSLLIFLNMPADYQNGAVGVILLAVLALRALASWRR